MRAAVTEGVGYMRLRDVVEPGEPRAGEVVVRPQAVGLCGSDYHLFAGELSEAAGGSSFPRVQGHEVAATIEAVGPDCRPELEVGARVALWPLTACGECYPCRAGRPNACDHFRLIGIHDDGGLQERLRIAQSQVFRIETPPVVAALAEPVSIAVRAVRRGRIGHGERVVVLGAGPIGHAVALAARDRGAEVLAIDRVGERLRLSAALGADALVWRDAETIVAAAREWSGGEGAAVVVDATGVPAAVRAGFEIVASAGRFVQVGMSGESLSLRLGVLTEKELDVLGVSVCVADESAAPVDLAEPHGGVRRELVTHESPLERAPEAIAFAM